MEETPSRLPWNLTKGPRPFSPSPLVWTEPPKANLSYVSESWEFRHMWLKIAELGLHRFQFLHTFAKAPLWFSFLQRPHGQVRSLKAPTRDVFSFPPIYSLGHGFEVKGGFPFTFYKNQGFTSPNTDPNRQLGDRQLGDT